MRSDVASNARFIGPSGTIGQLYWALSIPLCRNIYSDGKYKYGGVNNKLNYQTKHMLLAFSSTLFEAIIFKNYE